MHKNCSNKKLEPERNLVDNGERQLATKLDVSASTLNRVLKQKSSVSPEMALRLSKALERTPESWLAMQDAFNLWKARKQVKLGRVHSVKLEPLSM